MTRSPFSLRLTASFFCLCCSTALLAAPPAGSRWEPIPELTDEFEGSELDASKWHDHNPGWKGRQPGFFSRENVTVSDGKLHLTARAEGLPNLPEGYHTFTTAAVKAKALVKYGYFEIKCRPMKSGASSAFWFYQSTKEEHTEIDVFEICGVGDQWKNVYHMNLHVFRTPTEKKHWSRGDKWISPYDLADEYHVYALQWDKDAIKWFVDGKVVHETENTHWHQPLHLNFDSETMPEWFGLPEKKDLPSTFSIEYVRSWQKVETAEPPNIILCMGDDHGWDETAYNGHPHLQTPVLDEMAATGLRLNRFYSASPVCSPTRGSVITGRHPNRYGTFSPGWSIRPEEISIAQVLGKAGYTCGHFGKWHLGPVKAESPTNPGAMGFDKWVSHDNFFEMNPVLSRNGGPPERFEGESSEVVIDETIRFIAEAKPAGRPFFAVVWFGSPHEPYSGLEKDLALYDDLPQSYQERSVSLTSMETGLRTKRPLREVLRERFAEITAMDRAMGKLRKYLDDEGLRENTLVWYCGDNGTPQEGAATVPFRGVKGAVYEGGVRVPGVIEWPARIPRPRVSDVNSVTSDIFPTLCDLVGQPLSDRPLDGISLKPLIDGEMIERPQPICFWNYDSRSETKSKREPYIDLELQKGTTPLVKQRGGRLTRNFSNLHHPTVAEADFGGPRAILGNRYKLVIEGRRGNETASELFDVRDDPAEEHNLIEARPEVAKELERELRGWQESVLESLTGGDYQ